MVSKPPYPRLTAVAIMVRDSLGLPTVSRMDKQFYQAWGVLPTVKIK